MRLEKYARHWAVYDEKDELVCVTVYKKGGEEVIRRLSVSPTSPIAQTATTEPVGA